MIGDSFWRVFKTASIIFRKWGSPLNFWVRNWFLHFLSGRCRLWLTYSLLNLQTVGGWAITKLIYLLGSLNLDWCWSIDFLSQPLDFHHFYGSVFCSTFKFVRSRLRMSVIRLPVDWRPVYFLQWCLLVIGWLGEVLLFLFNFEPNESWKVLLDAYSSS